MEDGKNLDLCLGLTCGGGTSSAKAKHGSSSENTSDEGDRERKLMNEFKNFLEGGIQHPIKPDENTYNINNAGKAVVEIESSRSSASGGDVWVTNGSRSEAEIENKPVLGEKRKNVSSDTNQSKKHERETSQPEKTHISITTDEGSTADNEDVADSEVDGSTSRPVSQPADVSKRFVVSGTQSRVQQEVHVYGDRNGAELSKPNIFNMSSGKDFNITNMPYGASFPMQSPNVVNMSYSQPLSGYPVSGTIHTVGGVIANGERPGIQSVMPANFPLMFGYNPIQLPTLDKDNSRVTISHHQQMLPTYGRNQLNSDTRDDSRKLTQATMQPVISQMSPEFTQYDRRAIDQAKNNAKQHVTEEGSSGHAEGASKNHTTQDASRQLRTESVPSEFPAIRPGVAADLKFGGCGSYPNLPWVSTTGPGPNGRTISGVTYRYSPTQIRIVCACHGSHLSPEEFVRHATEDNGTRESMPGLASFPSSNPAASAQS